MQFITFLKVKGQDGRCCDWITLGMQSAAILGKQGSPLIRCLAQCLLEEALAFFHCEQNCSPSVPLASAIKLFLPMLGELKVEEMRRDPNEYTIYYGAHYVMTH